MFSEFLSENRAVYEIMSKNVVEPERPQMTIWRRVACWISKVTGARAHTHTHTQIYNTTLPRQQWFLDRNSTLRYAYIACLV